MGLLLPFDFVDVGDVGEDERTRGVGAIDLDEIVFIGLFYRLPGFFAFACLAASRALMA